MVLDASSSIAKLIIRMRAARMRVLRRPKIFNTSFVANGFSASRDFGSQLNIEKMKEELDKKEENLKELDRKLCETAEAFKLSKNERAQFKELLELVEDENVELNYLRVRGA